MENQTTLTETNSELNLLGFHGLSGQMTPENEEARKIIKKAIKKKKKMLEQFHEGRILCSDSIKDGTNLAIATSTVAVTLATIYLRTGLGPNKGTITIFAAPLVVWLFMCWMNSFKKMKLTYERCRFLLRPSLEAKLILEDIQLQDILVGLKGKARWALQLPEVSEATLLQAKRNDWIQLTYVIVLSGLGSFVGLVGTMLAASS